jgi:hypothetical protein
MRRIQVGISNHCCRPGGRSADNKNDAKEFYFFIPQISPFGTFARNKHTSCAIQLDSHPLDGAVA